MRGLTLLWLLPGVASARELPLDLAVEQRAGAEQCDDRSALERRVQRLFASPSAPPVPASPLALEVRFERDADGAFVAHVSARGAKPGERELRDSGPTCEALSQAVSVAIALLLDNAVAAQSAAPAPEEHEALPVTPSSAVGAEPAAVTGPTGGAAASLRWLAALDVGAAYGLGGDTSALGGGRLGLRAGGWAFDLAGSGSLPLTTAFGGGSVRTSLLFAGARACYLFGRRVALGPCLQVGVGRLRGTGTGYEQAQVSSLLWSAGGVGASAETTLGDRAYLALTASLWVPSRRQTFSVQNAGIAWESRPVAGALGAGLGVWLF